MGDRRGMKLAAAGRQAWRRLRPPARVALGLVGLAAVWIVVRSADPARARPTAPTPVADDPLEDASPPSSIDVPVHIDVDVLTRTVEGRVPTEWVEDSVRSAEGGRPVAMAFTRGPFSASVDGEVARLSATVAYALRTSYAMPLLPDMGVSCGTDPDEPAPRMDIEVEAPIRLGADWSLRSASRVARLEPSTDTDRDRCEVTFLGVDITERVAREMRSFLEGHTGTIDSLVAAVELRSRFEEWWRALLDPIALHDDAWLAIRPEAIAGGEVRGRGSTLEVVATLTARPAVVFGPRPPSSTLELPALADSATGSDFEAVVDVYGEYGEVSEALTNEFRGTEVSGAGQVLVIDAIVVSGIGRNQVAVEVRVSGDADGSLYLVGTPSYSREDGFVRLPDLTMTVSTSDWLVAGASWVLDAGLERLLRQRTRWPVDGGVAWARMQAERGLNATVTEGLRLEGEVRSLDVLDVYARSEGILVRARLSGTVRLFVEEG